MSNRFDGVETIHSLIAQTVGAGSSPVLWKSDPMDPIHPSNLGGYKASESLPATRDVFGRSCTFQSQLAVEIADESVAKLRELLEHRLILSGAVDPDDAEFLVGYLLDAEEG